MSNNNTNTDNNVTMNTNNEKAVHRLIAEMKFQKLFDDGFWASDCICSYTSKNSYKVGDTNYNVVICANYKTSTMEAFLATENERDFVAKIGEMKTDYPSKICEAFSLYNIEIEIIMFAVG